MDRLTELETIFKEFRMVGQDGITVHGSLPEGYAVNAQAQEGGETAGFPVPIIPPPPPLGGACCVGVDCTIQTESDCTDLGGTYQGDDTECDPNPCGATGACCIGGECSVVSEAVCTDGGGTYFGDGTECLDLTCGCPCGFEAFDGSGRRFLRYHRTISGSYDLNEVQDCPAPDGFTYEVSASCSATFEQHYNSDCSVTTDIDTSSSERTETLNGDVVATCSHGTIDCFCNTSSPFNACSSFLQFCHGCAIDGGFGGCGDSGITATTKTTTCDLSGSCSVITSACAGTHHDNCDQTGSFVVTETLSEECIPI